VLSDSLLLASHLRDLLVAQGLLVTSLKGYSCLDVLVLHSVQVELIMRSSSHLCR
jgi:hypothetical protein